MPELPEVETTCRGIAPYVQGQTIKALIVRQPRLRWPVPANLAEIITGQRIHQVSRRAKYLLMTVDTGTIVMHLGMSGSLRVLTSAPDAGAHDHVDFIFGDNSVLRLNDPRRFGAVLWTDAQVSEHALLKDLGPEPLSDSFSGKLLYDLSRKRKTPVKTFIMDSHVVVGVGNIYANEALFSAGILPTRLIGELSLTEYQALAEAIRVILLNAIKQGGTTLRNFVNEAGKPGYFKQELQVYGRAGLACVHCGVALVEIRLSNRSTVFCPHCQH
ncbi:bifunctional DNA-formamidopyrimidine glycosylase/DNA-(apurinic or apyrimidinic site) lyase [Methylocucumis oryzae]|uniref:Formamidopyrimidine-DNA glycosylase n=1 Tax=Methylocucumis oryzae TaxID=1632867 RepID=A0A0F3IIY3_9GAMM|nr:bifunctional DNA-formamidopyrimidine glycosylase/DNA-(apurinic or apyrimidinic site) lyase [Methylocucumis oryzae]KJV06696.1 5-hydroxymethyluracil DNA glycosylase [Methylocucumis oryzae]